MKLRIQADDFDLSPRARSAIDDHLRIALGNRSTLIHAARIVFSIEPDSNEQVCCRIALRDAEGVLEEVEETARDLEIAMEWAIWRLIHSLDRRALRAANARLTVDRPDSPRRS